MGSGHIRRWLPAGTFIMVALIASHNQARAITLNVDRTAQACSDSGVGSIDAPLCTVQAAARRAESGDIVLVHPGVYREQVTPTVSGTPELPITYSASGPGVEIDGSVDLSGPAGWAPTSGTAWRHPLDTAPRQVLLDDRRLAPASATTAMTTNSYAYDAFGKALYVDIGGHNPGLGRTLQASIRNYGFNLLRVHDIVIEGFWLRRQALAGVRIAGGAHIEVRDCHASLSADNGIRIDSNSGAILVSNATVERSGSVGIALNTASGVTVDRSVSHDNGSHGISLAGSSENLIARNRSYANARPNVRAANGINLGAGSLNNTILANSTYENQDSGIQVFGASNDNLIVRNASWLNQDHGFDTNNSSRTRYVSNTAYGNLKDGFSIEGASVGTRLTDNIALDNGVTTREFDLFVDSSSATDFHADFDIFYNSTAAFPIKVDARVYASVHAFYLATNYEANGLGADPLLVAPAEADLRPGPNSPAIDSADASASGFVSADRDGLEPFDDPAAANTGAGEPPFADRGAFERSGPVRDNPPIAVIGISPTIAAVGADVTADASGSEVFNGDSISSYAFDFGDGSPLLPQAAPLATHSYAEPGIYPVSVLVADIAGLTSSASTSVSISEHVQTAPVPALVLTPSRGAIDLTVTADASGSLDQDATPIASYVFDFGDGVVIGPQPQAQAVHTYTIVGIYTVSVTVSDTADHRATTQQRVTVVDNAPNVVLSRTPPTGRPPLTVTVDASRSTDTDATPIVSYAFNFGDGSPLLGPQPSPIATHTYVISGNFKIRVTVTDSAGNSSSSQVPVNVRNR